MVTLAGARKNPPIGGGTCKIILYPSVSSPGFVLVTVEEYQDYVLLVDFRITGRLATAHPVYLGITVQHPNGDFAGRFVTTRPADEFQSGKDFQVTLDFQGFQLDSSLVGMKATLPSKPFYFVVESIWFTTLEKKAGLEITEITLVAPTREKSH